MKKLTLALLTLAIISTTALAQRSDRKLQISPEIGTSLIYSGDAVLGMNAGALFGRVGVGYSFPIAKGAWEDPNPNQEELLDRQSAYVYYKAMEYYKLDVDLSMAVSWDSDGDVDPIFGMNIGYDFTQTFNGGFKAALSSNFPAIGLFFRAYLWRKEEYRNPMGN